MSMRRLPCREEPIAFADSANSDHGMRVSLPTEYKALTPAQTAVLRDYRARWAAIRRSTEAADRSAAEEGVRLAYNAAGLKPPTRLVWCESPLALFQLAGHRPALAGEPRARVRRLVPHQGADGAVPGVPPSDTIKTVDESGQVTGTLDRASLVAVQTPQAFRAGLLRRAHASRWLSSHR